MLKRNMVLTQVTMIRLRIAIGLSSPVWIVTNGGEKTKVLEKMFLNGYHSSDWCGLDEPLPNESAIIE